MASSAPDLFDKVRLPPELDELLRNANPWWQGKPGRVLPAFKRWAFPLLRARLIEAVVAPVVVLRGPRQVGKTTILEQMINHLIEERGVSPSRILRVQFDELQGLRSLRDPVLAIARWFENRILGSTFNQAAHAKEPAYLFLDEVQNLSDWAPQIKSLVDHSSVQVVVTGSSALRIEAGRDSLAGRITTIELGTLLLREIAELRLGAVLAPLVGVNGVRRLTEPDYWRDVQENGVRHSQVRDTAFDAFSARGGYPMVHALKDLPWEDIADQLNETVIRRVIQHDLRIGERGRRRDAALLDELFRITCRYAGQSPSIATYVGELRSVLRANVASQRIHTYLRFLNDTLLLRLVQPLELQLKKRKGNQKICLVDHGLRASWLQELVPLSPDQLVASPHLSDLAGHIAESVVGAFLASMPALDIAHFPERAVEPEVDFVLTIGERRIPFEVKYRRRIDAHRDTQGLRAFIEKAVYNAPFGVLVTLDDGVRIPDPRIVPVSLRSLLLMR